MSKTSKTTSNTTGKGFGKAAAASKAPKGKGKAPAKVAAKTTTAAIGDAALATVYKVKKQYAQGVRQLATQAVSAKGSSLGDIAAKLAKQDKDKFTLAKTRGYVYWLASNGYLTRVEA